MSVSIKTSIRAVLEFEQLASIFWLLIARQVLSLEGFLAH
jgi:hypothetical protein